MYLENTLVRLWMKARWLEHRENRNLTREP